MLQILVSGPSGTLVKEQGTSNLVAENGEQSACFETLVHWASKGSNPNSVLIVILILLCRLYNLIYKTLAESKVRVGYF